MAGEDFLLWQSASSHILVLATGSNIRLMATRRTWALDGTFKVVPQWYQQLFTIHAFLAGKLVPAVYCLCTDKDIATYGILCLYQITAKSILVFVCAIFGIVSLENFYVLLTLERVSPPIEYWLMLVP
ncbi:hypothetical protein T05_10961 [Trichinella murrelli]|uniref:Uncharacterized protein n=1 Tax=Trichinella murrelli TaxID=144512 RepID=A0A0V0U6K0_9BILA|nr:hypothetical protein T05_10961 [Trichinella murrelli]